jgi:penicillin amidase
MRKPGLLLICAALTAFTAGACGSDSDSGPPSPYDSITAEKTLRFAGLDGKVDIVRDEYGIPHIHATSEGDAAFANGYIVAHDRMLQLELLRNLAKGEIGKMFGALDAAQIDSDLSMRMHRIGPRAQAQVDALAASSDPADQATHEYITRFSDGVNAYITDLKAQKYELDGPVAVFLAPEKLEPWTAADSIALGLFQAWSLSFDETELRLTRGRDKARAEFDESAVPARLLRAGAWHDLFPIEQLDKESTIEGWPNVDTDTGTRARVRPRAPRPAPAPVAARRSLAALDNALRLVHPMKIGGMVFGGPEDGSNNWVVDESLTGGGKTLLANDPHLSLSSPALFHAVHITVPGKLNVSGVSLAGVPGVLIGYNDKIAWGITTAYHDVVDWYEDTVAPCSSGGGNCVTRDGAEVRLEVVTEHFDVGALGTLTDSFEAQYEYVPDQGPVLPTIADNRIVPRTDPTAISLRYTGHDETHELRAINRLIHTSTLEEAFDALDDFEHGAQSWVITDSTGKIGYTSTARIPRRPATCFTYDPITAPDGQAPWFVSDGASGDCAWTGFMDPRYIPHSIDPAKGYLVTANTDPMGETFDGDALNGPIVDGAPLYAGFDYNSGFRIGRITRLLEELKATGEPMTLDDMARIQGDSYSAMGSLLAPVIVTAGDAFATATDPDIAAWKATLNPIEISRLTAAIDRLDSWSFETPTGVGEGLPAAEVNDSVATSIYNIWQVAFFNLAFGDELALVGEVPNRLYTLTTAVWALTEPSKLVTGIHADTGEAVLCDHLDTAEVEGCTLMVLQALHEGLTQAEAIFGDADQATWRWGIIHTVTFESLVPAAELTIPPITDPINPRGFPREGDVLAVDVASNSVSEYEFEYTSGPAMRLLVERPVGDGQAIARFALPGGEILDHRSPHFRDLADQYWVKNLYFELPRSTEQIIDKAETRWVFRP